MSKDYFIQKSPEEKLLLDCYGPTESENEWTEKKKQAFRMSKENAEIRQKYLLKFFPRCFIVEA